MDGGSDQQIPGRTGVLPGSYLRSVLTLCVQSWRPPEELFIGYFLSGMFLPALAPQDDRRVFLLFVIGEIRSRLLALRVNLIFITIK